MLACYLHTLPGTPFVFQGEELGMTNVAFPSIDDYNDIDTRNYYKTMIEQGASPEEALAESRSISRDNARTPMQWNDSPNGGFSEHTPWLGVNPNYKLINAESQMNDDCSVFRFYQNLIALRKKHPVMAHGDFKLCCPEDGPVIAIPEVIRMKHGWQCIISLHPCRNSIMALKILNYRATLP